MTRSRPVLFTIFATTIALATTAGCASQQRINDETAAATADDAPADPIWAVAAHSPPGTAFQNGDETCAVGHAEAANPTTGQETAEFAASIAIAAMLKLPAIDDVNNLPHRSSWWRHANNLTHDVALCVRQSTNLASR